MKHLLATIRPHPLLLASALMGVAGFVLAVLPAPGLAAAGLAVAAAGFFATLIVTFTTVLLPLMRLRETVSRLGAGDLTVRLDEHGGSTGVVASFVDDMTRAFHTIVTRLDSAAEHIDYEISSITGDMPKEETHKCADHRHHMSVVTSVTDYIRATTSEFIYIREGGELHCPPEVAAVAMQKEHVISEADVHECVRRAGHGDCSSCHDHTIPTRG